MRPFAWFLLGALAGIVGTVMFYTLDPIFRGDEGETSGGGNLRLVMDAEAVSTLVERVGADLAEPVAGRVEIEARAVVETSGLVDLELEVRDDRQLIASGAAVFDPEIADGTLAFTVVRDGLPGLVDAQALAEGMSRELAGWLDQVAMDRPYRVVAIATADGRLAVEIAFRD